MMRLALAEIAFSIGTIDDYSLIPPVTIKTDESSGTLKLKYIF